MYKILSYKKKANKRNLNKRYLYSTPLGVNRKKWLLPVLTCCYCYLFLHTNMSVLERGVRVGGDSEIVGIYIT